MKNRIKRQSAISGAQQFITLEQVWGACNFIVVVHYATGGIVGSFEFGNDSHAADRYYFEQCKVIEVDPSPEYTKAANLQSALTAVGWVHVHTWQESHGEYSSHIFEKPASFPGSPVFQLYLDIYRDAQDATELRINSNPEGSHLLAREIKANESGWWVELGARSISRCCTSGSQYFVHRLHGTFAQVTGVAGHGEWASVIEPSKSPETHAELSALWSARQPTL